MHIPDGFISPKMYVPAYVTAAALWAYGLRRVGASLQEEAIPKMAVMTALAFVLMMIALPLPGGTSAHASGIAILAVTFGIWIGYLSLSLVLLLQAFFFGAGGVTSLAINALAMGLAGAAVASTVFRALRRFNERVALFAAGWLSAAVPAALMAVALGLQPMIAHADDGTPLFFPFDLSVTLPAVVIPYAIVGIGEGVLTVAVSKLFWKLKGDSGR